jgi:hypothetical protein
MAFVNKRITKNNLKWYGIPEIKQRILPGQYLSSRTCTIDPERSVYLIKTAEEREQRPDRYGLWPTGLYGWVFVWQERELWVETRELERTEERGGSLRSLQRLTSLGRMGEEIRMLGEARRLPPEWMPQREEILKDLYEALRVHKDSGVFSSCARYELRLEMAEGI